MKILTFNIGAGACPILKKLGKKRTKRYPQSGALTPNARGQPRTKPQNFENHIYDRKSIKKSIKSQSKISKSN